LQLRDRAWTAGRSDSDVPHPVSDYGKSKLLAEQETLKHKEQFSIVVLRPSAVYGPRDTDMYELFRWASRGVMLDVAGGDRFINPCYVEDLAAATLLAGEQEVKSGRFISWLRTGCIPGANSGKHFLKRAG
jgi:nucleoside-diphosphate-sugar epimerase